MGLIYPPCASLLPALSLQIKPLDKSLFGLIKFKENNRVIDCQSSALLETLFRTREYEYIHFAIGSDHYELTREFFLANEITIYAVATMVDWPKHVKQYSGEDNMWGTIYSGKKIYLNEWPNKQLIARMLMFREKNQSLHKLKVPKIFFAR